MAMEILRLRAVCERTGLRPSSVYQRIREDRENGVDHPFPAPIKIGARASGWLAWEISQWVEARIAASRPAEKSEAAA